MNASYILIALWWMVTLYGILQPQISLNGWVLHPIWPYDAAPSVPFQNVILDHKISNDEWWTN